MDVDTGVDLSSFIVGLLVWAVGVAILLTALFFVVRAAILSALREHTMNSTTAVSVVSAVPLTVTATPSPGDQ